MTSDDRSKSRIRARMATAGEPYNVARHIVDRSYGALQRARRAAETHMTTRRRQGHMWNETTITDILCAAAHPDITYVQFNQRQERHTGADWLWWWLTGTGECFGLLAQAKTLHHRSSGWFIDFHTDQNKALFATARELDVAAAYILYAGDVDYRTDITCGQSHDPNRCHRCDRAAVSIVAALLVDHRSVGGRRTDTAEDTFRLASPLEDLADPLAEPGSIPDLNLRHLNEDLRQFLLTPQHGPRHVAKMFFERVSRTRRGQFLVATAEHAQLSSAQVFPQVPTDRGHFREPYFQHILRSLRTEPPIYLRDALDGQPLPDTLTQQLDGLVIIQL